MNEIEDKKYTNYPEWLMNAWHGNLYPTYGFGKQKRESDVYVDNEDNSVEMSVQQIIEENMPELLDVPYKIIIILENYYND